MTPMDSPVYLKDIWPAEEEIRSAEKSNIKPSMFEKEYSGVLEGPKLWKELDVPAGTLYDWNPMSTYIQEPPYFVDFPPAAPLPENIEGARVLAVFGDSITTDHISPAGDIPSDSPAGKYLISWGVDPEGLQLLWFSKGKPRGNDARNLWEYPAQEQAGDQRRWAGLYIIFRKRISPRNPVEDSLSMMQLCFMRKTIFP